MPKLKINMGIMNCSECNKYNVGIKLYNAFDWSKVEKIITYEKDNQEIVIDEKRLMQLIQVINPKQLIRPIRLKGGEKD